MNSSIKNAIGQSSGLGLIANKKNKGDPNLFNANTGLKQDESFSNNPYKDSYGTDASSVYSDDFKKALKGDFQNSFDKLNFQLLAFDSREIAGKQRDSEASLNAALKKSSPDFDPINKKDAWLDNNATTFASEAAEEAKRLFVDNETNKKDELDEVNSLMDELGFEGDINQNFLDEFNSRGGEINSGSRDTEKSFNPLNIISEDKDGFKIRSLNAFFKKSDIQDAGLKSYAEGLGDYNWATMSRAMGELLSNAYKEQGLSDKEILNKTSTQMTKAAQLFEGTRFEKNSQAMTFMLAHLALDKDVLDKSGIDSSILDKLKEGDNAVLFGEALKHNPDLLDNQEIFNSLKDTLAKESQNKNLDHLTQEVKAGSLNNIYGDMHSLLGSKYAEQMKELSENGIDTSKAGVDKLMGELGFSPGGDEYRKVNNADAVAQTFINYASLKHDSQLQQQGSLTDENRLLNPAAQISVRFTPDAGEDHNGAFNEKNIGRDKASMMGQNNDQLAQFIIPGGSDKHMMDFFNKVSETGNEISNLDVSKHGYSQGAGNLGSGDIQLIKAMGRAMAPGGEIVLNSCDCGSGSDKGGGANVANSALKNMAEQKGLKLHAATISTMGYTEHTGFDVGSGQFFMTPVKLDGATGGITLEAPDPEKLADDRGLKENQHANYINTESESSNNDSAKEEEKEAEFNFVEV